MKDEVEKLFSEIIDLGITLADGKISNNIYLVSRNKLLTTLLALLDKAQVEAVRAGRIKQLIELRDSIPDGELTMRLNKTSLTKQIMKLDRLANLKEDEETE